MPKKSPSPTSPTGRFDALTEKTDRFLEALEAGPAPNRSPVRAVLPDVLTRGPQPSATPTTVRDVNITFDFAFVDQAGKSSPVTRLRLSVAPTPTTAHLAIGDENAPLKISTDTKAPDAAGDKVLKALDLLLRASCDTAFVKRLLTLPSAPTTTQAALFIMGQAIHARHTLRGSADETHQAIANKLLQICRQLLDAGVDTWEVTSLPPVKALGRSEVIHMTVAQLAGLFVDAEMTQLLLQYIPDVIANVDFSRTRAKLIETGQSPNTITDVDNTCVAFPIIEQAVRSRLLRTHLQAAYEITYITTRQAMKAIAEEPEVLQNDFMSSLSRSIIEAEIVEMMQGMAQAAIDTRDGMRHLDVFIAQAALYGRTRMLRVLLTLAATSEQRQTQKKQLHLSATGLPGLLSMVVEAPNLSKIRIKEVLGLLMESDYDPRSVHNVNQAAQGIVAASHNPASCAAMLHDAELTLFIAHKQHAIIAQSSAEHKAQFDMINLCLDLAPAVLVQGQTQELRAALRTAKRMVRILHSIKGFGHYCSASAEILQALAPIDSEADATPIIYRAQSKDSEFSEKLFAQALDISNAPTFDANDFKRHVEQAVINATSGQYSERLASHIDSLRLLNESVQNTDVRELDEPGRMSQILQQLRGGIEKITSARSSTAGLSPSAQEEPDTLTFEDYYGIFKRVKAAIASRLDPADNSISTRRKRVQAAIDSLPELSSKPMQQYGTLLAFVCDKRTHALQTYVEAGAPFSLPSLAQAFFLATRHAARAEQSVTRPNTSHVEACTWLVKAARTSDEALVLLHTAVLIGASAHVKDVVAHMQDHDLDISALLSDEDPTLLHDAISAGPECVALLTDVIDPSMMRAWVTAVDASGDNALFVASRADSGSMPYLLSCVDDPAALVTCINSDGRTLIDDALYFNSTQALRALWALPALTFDPERLTQLAPSTKAILVTGPCACDERALHALRRIPQGHALLRLASPDLLKAALRENDDAMVRFVLQHYGPYVSMCAAGETNILHVLASCDASFALQQIEVFVSPQERRSMAHARHTGLRAEALTNNAQIAARLASWRNWVCDTQTQTATSPHNEIDPAAKKAAKRAVRAAQPPAQPWAAKARLCTSPAQHEALMHAFVAEAQTKGPSNHADATLVAQGWQIVDTLDVYGCGRLFGQHYARHHRDVHTDALRARLSSGAVEGSSQFGPHDSIGLIEARMHAQRLIRAAPVHAAMSRCVVHVRHDSLSGRGFVTQAATQSVLWFEGSRTLRFVFVHAAGGQHLHVISCFPVPDASVGPNLLNRVVPADS